MRHPFSTRTSLNLVSKSKLIYVPSDKAYCGGWAFDAVIVKAYFRRIPGNGKSSLTMRSLQYYNSIPQNVFSAICTAMVEEDN